MVSKSFSDRPLKKLCLFDVDGTLTPARQVLLYLNLQGPLMIVIWAGCITADDRDSAQTKEEIGRWLCRRL